MHRKHGIINRLRIVLAIPFFIFLFYIAQPKLIFYIIGFITLIGGVFLRIWASGYIYKREKLAKDGPYSYCRHPLYFSNFLIGLSFCFGASKVITFIIFILLFSMLYYLLIIEEEKLLQDKYKSEFLDYKRTTPCFIPHFKKYKSKSSFNFKLAKKNREPITSICFLLLYFVLIIKFFSF